MFVLSLLLGILDSFAGNSQTSWLVKTFLLSQISVIYNPQARICKGCI